MTKAVILSAGQGTRLSPLTKDKPKCLVEIHGKPVLGWQIDALVASGVKEIVVVTGFRDDLIVNYLATLNFPGVKFKTKFNPFYKVSDNLATCWIARKQFKGTCLLINGDTLFSQAIAESLLAAPENNVTITIDQKDTPYDDDDMKVQLDGAYLQNVGKTLPLDIVSGEAIGMIRFQNEGGPAFARILEHHMRQQTGVKKWYLSAVADLADDRMVKWHSIKGMPWGELDDLQDLEIAKKLLASAHYKAA